MPKVIYKMGGVSADGYSRVVYLRFRAAGRG